MEITNNSFYGNNRNAYYWHIKRLVWLKHYHFLNDSKQLNKKQRYELRPLIESQALDFAYAHISPKEIDQINILNASIKAMHLALMQLKKQPEFIAVDGNRFHSFDNVPHHCIIKGDTKYLNIAAASVLAKTYRDDYMVEIHEEYPDYLWKKNKGYPTKDHRAAIKLKGPTPYHRKSFQLLSKQLEIDFKSKWYHCWKVSGIYFLI